MKIIISFALVLLIYADLSFAQLQITPEKDSLLISANIGLRGRWQTGNLNSLSLMPNASISLRSNAGYAELNSTYHYLRINGFNSINDFWNYGLYQHRPEKKFFPALHLITGFARSYKIDHSLVGGLGAGWNAHQKSAQNFLQVHLFLSYLNFKFQEKIGHRAAALGSLIKANFPLGQQLNLRWELSSFHSLQDNQFWGGGNLFQLNFVLFKSLMMNISHQTFYNHQTAEGIKQTNTEMLFGLSYNFSKKL